MHGTATPELKSADPKASRIAALSAEYLEANPDRCREIGEEIAAIIDGNVIALPCKN